MGPSICIRVFSVSTGNIAMCSTIPATEPASMYFQKPSPSPSSWVVGWQQPAMTAGGGGGAYLGLERWWSGCLGFMGLGFKL